MRGVEISSLDLDNDGAVVVQNLATVFEDGEVVGASYLASSLRKAVEERGPASLDRVIRVYNNGYYGASWVTKGRVYIKPGQEPPTGFHVEEGPRGGRYYETIGREAKGAISPRRVIQTEFGVIRYDREDYDSHTQTDYKVFQTARGPEIWIKAAPGEDKPWAVTKKDALSLRSFLKSVAFMSRQARNDMRRHVKGIVLSPVGNPHDRKLSKMLGTKFTSSATMDMKKRIMHIFPKYKHMNPSFTASIITHEVGHAVDDERGKMVIAYNEKVAAAIDRALEERGGWRNEGGEVPISTPALDNFLEKEYGVLLPHPNRSISDAWQDVRKVVDIGLTQKVTPEDVKRRSRPPNKYAMTNIVEYFAECYDAFHSGRLAKGHIMYKFFKQWPTMERWIKE